MSVYRVARLAVGVLLSSPLVAADGTTPVSQSADASSTVAPVENDGDFDGIAGIPLEVHGFTSIGYFQTGKNEWLVEDSTDGSWEFWEFGINLTSRPVDHWRFGAQVFARDLGRYDNGRLQLDWLYADYRAMDELGLQVGRVKIPYGLYNELLDVDSARTPVFLPQSVYALRTRDLLISCDGGKAYGYVDLGIGGGGLEYSAYVGGTTIDDESGTAQVFRDRGFEEDLDIDIDYRYGGILHWHTPIEGLGFRFSLANTVGLDVSGRTPSLNADNMLEVDQAPSVVLSAEYELEQVTFAAEWSKTQIHGDLTTTIDGGPLGSTVLELPFRSDAIGLYVSADWHVAPRWDVYAAFDATANDSHSFDDPEQSELRYVLATRYGLLENFAIKAEGQYVDGNRGVLSGEDGGEKSDDWWLIAFKTTVDF